MANIKISALPVAATPLAGTEVLPIVQSGVTRKVSVADLTLGRAITASGVTNSALTNGRVTYAGASGVLQDSLNLLFDGVTLTTNTLSVTNAIGIASGGTGQTTANAAFNALVPSQTSNSGKYLTTNGTNTSWATIASGGTVTSVAASVPSFLSIAGSPITSSGTLAISYSGTALPVANGGTGITTTPTNGQIPIGNGTNYTAATLSSGYGVNITNGSGSVNIATNIATPQIIVYTTGSGTYTTPANCKWLDIVMVGGGGGGSGSSSSAGTGGTGGTTSLGSSNCTGGIGGVVNNSLGGAGGVGTISGGTGLALIGGYGTGGVTTGVVGTYPTGGAGGNTVFGGSGSGAGGSSPGNGGNAISNTGAGGGGASCGAVQTFSGPGGGAGGYVKMIITSPSATYSYAVGAGGAGGAAGTSGFAGGAGGSGVIIITAYF